MVLKVGIISANWGAFAHLPAWRAIPGVEVTSICTSRETTAREAANRLRIDRAFWDASVMIADPDIDIIDCGTRPITRHSMILEAFKHKKHVYNGIPFAADYARACEFHDAWKQSGCVGVVDAFSQWIPAHQRAQDLISTGKFGTPLSGIFSFQMPIFNPARVGFPYNWFWQSGLGVSALRNLGSHGLHTLMYLFGEVSEVVAHDHQLFSTWEFPDGGTINPETNDCAISMLRFKSGFTLQFFVSWSATLGQGWSLDVFGTKGRMQIESPSFPSYDDTVLRFGDLSHPQLETVSSFDSAPTSGIATETCSFPPPALPMAISMKRMVETIQRRNAARPDFEQAWQVERVLEAMRISSVQRTWIKIADV